MNIHTAKPDSKPHESQVAGWTLQEVDVVGSTNFFAAKLSAWHAVRADTQTAGRGRFQRSWVSDAGGLWLSAVVPVDPDRQRWEALPLVAGLALIESLKKIGINSARLRWPNDIMVNERKLAGLLVDNFTPKLAVIGIGVNVTNHPDEHDETLKTTTTRLADLVPHPPSLAVLTATILVELRSAITSLANAGFGGLHPQINKLWGEKRRVSIDLDGVKRSGLFMGVDDCGRLLLQDEVLRTTALEPHQVRLLREI